MNLLSQPWDVEFHSGIPVYKQIMNFIQAAIGKQWLMNGDQLPTIREIHEKLNVNPNTVAKAYRELELKGVISSQRGRGSFVASREEGEKLSQKEKTEKLDELCARLVAEAAGYGIQPAEIFEYLSQKQNNLP